MEKGTLKKVAPSTMETYENNLNGRILPNIGHMKLENIKPIHINAFLEELSEAGLSSSSINKIYYILNSIYKLAVKNEIIKKKPLDKVDRLTVQYKAGEVYNSTEL